MERNGDYVQAAQSQTQTHNTCTHLTHNTHNTQHTHAGTQHTQTIHKTHTHLTHNAQHTHTPIPRKIHKHKRGETEQDDNREGDEQRERETEGEKGERM